jgi:hypothetical protein
MNAARDANGSQVANPSKFPNGFKAVADYIHSLGLKSGLYTAKGPRTCAGFAASCQHEVQDAAQWAAWGIDYVKDDSCSNCRNDDNLDYHTMWLALELSGRPMVLTVEGNPDDALITLGGYGNAKRVGHDVSTRVLALTNCARSPRARLACLAARPIHTVPLPHSLRFASPHCASWPTDQPAVGLHDEPRRHWRAALALRAQWEQPDLRRVVECVCCSAGARPLRTTQRSATDAYCLARLPAAAAAAAAAADDLDMIEVGNAPDFTCGADAGALARCQAHYTQWCIMKAPLILGNDIPNETPATLSVLSNVEAVAVNQDALGVQAQRVNQAALPRELAPRSLPFGRGNHAVLARCDAASPTQAWALQKSGALATTDAAGRTFCLGSVDGALTEGSWAGVECGSPAAARFSVSRRDAATGSVSITTSPGGAALAFNNGERAAGPAPFARHVLALEGGGAGAETARWVLEGGRLRAAAPAGRVVEYDEAGRRAAPSGSAYCLDLAAGQLETWCGPLTGGRVAVSLFNRSPAPAPITVDFKTCNASNTNTVRDIWAAADRGSSTGSYTATVASEATAFLVLTPA